MGRSQQFCSLVRTSLSFDLSNIPLPFFNHLLLLISQVNELRDSFHYHFTFLHVGIVGIRSSTFIAAVVLIAVNLDICCVGLLYTWSFSLIKMFLSIMITNTDPRRRVLTSIHICSRSIIDCNGRIIENCRTINIQWYSAIVISFLSIFTTSITITFELWEVLATRRVNVGSDITRDTASFSLSNLCLRWANLTDIFFCDTELSKTLMRFISVSNPAVIRDSGDTNGLANRRRATEIIIAAETSILNVNRKEKC